MFLSKRSNGFWYIIFINEDGKRNSISTKTKMKKEAILFLSNFTNEIKFRYENKIKSIYFKDYYLLFLKYAERIDTEKTVKAFKTSFRFLSDNFNETRLSDLTKSKISQYLDERVRSSSIFAARKDLINLSALCKKAIQDGYLLTNPCKGIKQFKIPEKQPLFLSEAEYNILLNHIDNELIRDLVIFAVNTGIRQMELITLKWNQINFKEGLVSLDNREHITKSKKIRTIPLNISAKTGID